MTHIFKAFLQNEDGAVTVDWVVLTAAIVGIAASIFVFFGQPVKDFDAKNGAAIRSIDVAEQITITFD